MELALIVLFAAVTYCVVYWSVRLAVRDAIEDADERRAKAAKEPPRP